MIYLNILYFLIISWYGYKFLTSDGKIVKSPLDKNEELYFSGPEMFWTLTFSTGLLAFSVPLAIDLMAVRLMVIMILCFMGFSYAENKPVWSLPLKLYVVYLAWLVIGCFYTPNVGYGIRVILKYLYPLIIGLFASAVVRDVDVFLKPTLIARKIAFISFAVTFVPFVAWVLMSGVFWFVTARVINYISMVVFSLALYFFSGEKKNLRWAIFFCLPCILWVFRTSIMGTTLALMVFSLYKYKLKALPAIGAVLVLFIIAVFAIPSVKEKMFYKSDEMNVEKLQSGQISMADIDSNGRFAMWDWVMDEYYYGHEIAGSGTGNLQRAFYTLDLPFGGLKVIHNDYIQILCDNGIIGVVLFGLAYLMVIVHCFIVYNSKRYGPGVRMAALCAGPTLAGMMLAMYTDNVVNYSMATLSMPLGFYGMMLGMKQKEDEEGIEEIDEFEETEYEEI